MTVISLSKARKAREKEAKKAQANANAVKFGVPKAQKTLARTQAENAARSLDGHERE